MADWGTECVCCVYSPLVKPHSIPHMSTQINVKNSSRGKASWRCTWGTLLCRTDLAEQSRANGVPCIMCRLMPHHFLLQACLTNAKAGSTAWAKHTQEHICGQTSSLQITLLRIYVRTYIYPTNDSTTGNAALHWGTFYFFSKQKTNSPLQLSFFVDYIKYPALQSLEMCLC